MQDVRIKFQADTSDLEKARKALDDISKEEKEVADGMKKISAEGKKAATDIDLGFGKIGSTIKGVGATLAAVGAFEALSAGISKITEVTAKFQKFEAVLTNTLGSNSAAKRALNDITEFAAKTPFAVDEITESYIKLANRGLKPTTGQLRQLGDLAASQGKSLDQLTEATLDAITGENERLKEFGIQAKKVGDQTQFTFKGVTTTVENSDKAIQAYILSLGDAEGVTGSMAAISGTLDGQMNNLGDSVDDLALAFGETLAPAIGGVISVLSELTKGAAAAVRGTAAVISSEELGFFEKLSIFARSAFGDVNAIAEIATTYAVQKVKALGEEVEATSAGIAADTAAKVGLLTKLEKELKDLQQKQKDALSVKEIQAYERQIVRLRERIKDLTSVFDDNRGLFAGIEAFDISGYVKAEIDEVDRYLFDETAKKAEERLKALADRTAAALRPPTPEGLGSEDPELLREQAIQEARQRSYDLGVELGNAFFEFQSQKRDQDLADLQSKQAQELANAGDNEQKKQFIINKYAEEERKIRNRQAQADRQQALFNIAISTAAAIVKQLAATPLPVGAPLVALIAAQGALQAALVASRPIPKFRKGTEYLNGKPGTDTNLIWADTGERIIDRQTNRKLRGISNKQLPRLVQLGVLAESGKNKYDPAVVSVLERIDGNLRNQTKEVTNIDEYGIARFSYRQNMRKQQLNRKFSW